MIRWLGLKDDRLGEREESQARRAAARAALARLEELAHEPWVPREVVERLRALYRRREQHYRARLEDAGDGRGEDQVAAAKRLRLELLRAERRALIDLRDREVIGDQALREVERDLDLEELRLDPDGKEGAG